MNQYQTEGISLYGRFKWIKIIILFNFCKQFFPFPPTRFIKTLFCLEKRENIRWILPQHEISLWKHVQPVDSFSNTRFGCFNQFHTINPPHFNDPISSLNNRKIRVYFLPSLMMYSTHDGTDIYISMANWKISNTMKIHKIFTVKVTNLILHLRLRGTPISPQHK